MWITFNLLSFHIVSQRLKQKFWSSCPGVKIKFLRYIFSILFPVEFLFILGWTHIGWYFWTRFLSLSIKLSATWAFFRQFENSLFLKDITKISRFFQQEIKMIFGNNQRCIYHLSRWCLRQEYLMNVLCTSESPLNVQGGEKVLGLRKKKWNKFYIRKRI